MKIAFSMIVCNRRDGSARAVNEVAERLADRGHEVHLFARIAEDLDLNKIRWHKVPGPGWPEVANFWTYHVQANRSIPGQIFRHHPHNRLQYFAGQRDNHTKYSAGEEENPGSTEKPRKGFAVPPRDESPLSKGDK